MSILLDQETELILLGRWLVGSDTDDISLYTREIFVNFPGLYKAVVNGLPWDQISKADKSGVRYADIIGYGTESFLYRQARIDGLIAQRSLLIDKLNSADQDERDRADAERADEINRKFEDVVLNERAEEKFL